MKKPYDTPQCEYYILLYNMVKIKMCKKNNHFHFITFLISHHNNYNCTHKQLIKSASNKNVNQIK